MCEPQRTEPVVEAGPSLEHASALATTAPPAAPTPVARPTPPPRATPICRAMAIDGEVVSGGDAATALAPQAEVRPDEWLILAPKTRLVVKDPRSARETTFRGPGRVRACVDSVEESWMATGVFDSSLGSGESPGAEEWVVTPLGVVRFGAAQLSVEALAKEVRVNVGQGATFVWLAPGVVGRGDDGGLAPPYGPEEGWTRVTGGELRLTPQPPRPPSSVEAARSGSSGCVAFANSARDMATTLLGASRAGGGGDGSAGDGALAVQQVTTRRLAHAACAVAALRVDALPASALRTELAATLKDADAKWRMLPVLR
jgi:hypothetical protein